MEKAKKSRKKVAAKPRMKMKIKAKAGIKVKSKAIAKIKAKRRNRLDKTLYVYVKPVERHHALKHGKSKYGSASKYIGYLIAKDRGVKARIMKAKHA